MSDWHDNLVAFEKARDRQAWRMLGKIEAQQQEILHILRSKTSSPMGWVGEFGRTLLKALVPYLTPYVWFVVTSIGAIGVGLFKAFTRGWLL